MKMYNRSDFMDKVEDIFDKNYSTFKGSNEAELFSREEIADLVEGLLQQYTPTNKVTEGEIKKMGLGSYPIKNPYMDGIDDENKYERDIYTEGIRIGLSLSTQEKQPEREITELRDISDSYVVFEDSYDYEGLVQLSVTLPTLERAKQYVDGWKSKKLYIYQLVNEDKVENRQQITDG